MVPDVLGLPLEEAQMRLKEAGCDNLAEQGTAPPKGAIAGQPRVVRQRTVDRQIQLVVANFPLLEP